MEISFPISFETTPSQTRKLNHVQNVIGMPHKTQCHYFSCSPDLIYDQFVSQSQKDDGILGYYGLPSAREVAIDIITQFPKVVDDMETNLILEGLEIQQYFHADETPKLINSELIKNGFHINFTLKDAITTEIVEKMTNQEYSVFLSTDE